MLLLDTNLITCNQLLQFAISSLKQFHSKMLRNLTKTNSKTADKKYVFRKKKKNEKLYQSR